jgi:hypothetical protein
MMVVDPPTVVAIAFPADTVGDAVYASRPAVGGRAFTVCWVQVHIILASAFAASLG